MKIVHFPMPFSPARIGAVIDPNVIPVALVLSQQDRANIAAMDPDATVYCVFPAKFQTAQVQHFVELVKGNVEP